MKVTYDPKVILGRALALTEQYGFCQGVLARDALGEPTDPVGDDVASLCTVGFIVRAARDHQREGRGHGVPAMNFARDALRKLVGRELDAWNDAPGRTLDDLRAAFLRGSREATRQ
jgi:hypothetical protein